MQAIAREQRQQIAAWSRDRLQSHQLDRLNALLQTILPQNAFYARKLQGVRLPLRSLDDLQRLPFTHKHELIPAEEGEPWAANRTWSPDRYVRFHRTSGTHGRPLVVVDTAEDWQWWIDIWQYVLDAAEIQPRDRVMMAFSFGPFIGFWSANDALVARGAMVIPGGGLDTASRLELIRSSNANVLCCTPSYALHMAETARQQHIPLEPLAIDRIIVAGEPGGSVPAIRQRIEASWQARVIDHSGATEVGPWGYADRQHRGLHIVESEFLAEFKAVEHDGPAASGDLAELVLTTLGRTGSPVIRYRTGDLVRPVWETDQPTQFVLLQGGVLGRVDDMMIIRGVNIFPSAIEQILRAFPEVAEYRMIAHKVGEMDALTIEVEDESNAPERISRQLKTQLGLKVQVRAVPQGTLPRFEGKARRFVDQRR